MADPVKLKIDGKRVTVPAGTTILAAAEKADIHIPNLCYLKGLKGIGACRLCLVEIKGLKSPMTACTLKVKEGMVVTTQTEQINEIRKYVIDLILSMHPLDCMTCTKAGVCNLQQYSYDFEIKESSFSRKKFGFPIDEANPFIKRDSDYCILCSRCVRICKEQGTSVLDFSGRGVGSRVITADDRPLQESGCTFCGSCVDACPVNALLEADRWRKGREWEYEKVPSVCTLCGNACDIVVSTHEGEVAKINAGEDEAHAGHYICAFGRFGFDALKADTRVLSPLVKEGDALKDTSWKNALQTVAGKLKDPSTGIIASGSILNEDAFTLFNFSALASLKNVTSPVSLYADKESLIGEPGDIESADLIVLAGINPSQWKRVLPALDATIRKKVNRGAKLIVINEEEIPISKVAAIALISDEASALKNLAKALIDAGLPAPQGMEVAGAAVTEEIQKAAELYSGASTPLILASPALYGAAGNLALMKGSVVSVPFEANAKGLMLMGIEAQSGSYRDMVSGRVKVLYVIGDVPLAERPDVDFLIVQNSHMTELAKQADVVLPAADPLESEGSLIDYLGRLKEVRQAAAPAGKSLKHREIFTKIAKEMGLNMKPAKTADVKKVAKETAGPTVGEFRKRDELVLDAQDFMQSANAQIINGSRLFWLKETEEAVPA